MTTSDNLWYLDVCLEIVKAPPLQRPTLTEALCDRLDIDEIDFGNPLCMFVETALSQGFLAAHAAEDYRAALRFAEMAASVADRCPNFEMGRARTANNHALALMELGDFVAASALFEKALRCADGQEDPFGLVATIRSNLSAMESMRTGSWVSVGPQDDLPSPVRGAISTRSNRALSLMQAGRLHDAEMEFRALLGEFQTADIGTKATLLSNLAGVERELGATGQARTTLELAMRLCQEEGYEGQVLAGILYEHGELLIRNGSPEDREQAGKQFKRGWDIVRTISPRSRQALLLLRSLARLRMAQRDFFRARAALDRGMGIYDEMRGSVGTSEQDLAGLFEIYRQFVELRLWLVPQREGPLEAALLIQRAKARYWGEALARRMPTAPATDAARLESDDGFRHLVGFDGTMLEFFVGPNATFLCLIHNRHVAVHRINVTEQELAQQVEAVCVRLSTGLQSGRQLAALSSTLLGKLSLPWQRNRAILIAPDGPLWRMPMSLLRLPGSNATLEETAACFFIPSAGVLNQMRRQRRVANRRLGLLISHAGSGQETLTGTEEECQFVRQAMGSLGSVVVLDSIGESTSAATPARVLRAIVQATHVHFLAHAVGGCEVEESRVLLSGEDGNGEAHLTASQIEALDLCADLVVLATCESSLGRSRPGEGLASLARAFLLAGARCVIATLWEVDNYGSREFFRFFYRFIAGGEAPASAYRKAKRQYEAQYGRDGVSAGVVVLGDADSDEDRQDLRHIQPHLKD